MTETPAKVTAALLVAVAVYDGGDGALVDASPPGTTTEGVDELTVVSAMVVPSSGRAVVVVVVSLPPLLTSS
jgi:hypothetical protein